MTIDNEATLGYLLLSLVSGFLILIFFLLRARRTLQSQDLKTTPETAWKSISKHAQELNLSNTDLLFGIYQDASATEMAFLVKDTNDQLIGTLLNPTLSRKRSLTIGQEKFVIEFPLTWKRTAVLRRQGDERILARYAWQGQHQFEVTDFGLLKAVKPYFSFRATYDYTFNGMIIGSRANISSFRANGRVLILPSNFPLAVRIFILSM